MRTLIVAFLLLPLIALADMNVEIDLEWSPPTENVDGSPVDDLNGFTIYWGGSAGTYPFSQAVPDPTATTYTLPISNVQSGASLYVVMTASDQAGNESGYSNEVVFGAFVSEDVVAPSVPRGLRGTARIVRCNAGRSCSVE